MAVYLLNKNEICFPSPVLAEDNGLLAVGGRYISWEKYDGMLAEGTGRKKA